jgi:hypothetical protein
MATRTLRVGNIVHRRNNKKQYGCIICRDRDDDGFAQVEWFSAGVHQLSEHKLTGLVFVRRRA